MKGESGRRTVFIDSPAHYWVSSHLNPNRVEESQNEALILGRAAHHLLLGESDFSRLFSVRPDRWDSWRTNDAKAWKADSAGANARSEALRASRHLGRALWRRWSG